MSLTNDSGDGDKRVPPMHPQTLYSHNDDTPVVVQEAKTDADRRKHEIQIEEMTLDQFCAAVCHARVPDAAHLNLCATPEKM